MNSAEHLIVGLLSLLIAGSAVWMIGADRGRYRGVILATASLTTVLIVLGAYVRLSDAGLGCPDWPGCYGQLTPHHAADEIRDAESERPHGPVTMPKAWKEMGHRYLAGIVGSLILALAIAAWRNRRRFGESPALATSLVFVVGFQAVLGAWTVTMLLKPAIVTAHLIGGMTTLALLVWLALRQAPVVRRGVSAAAGLGGWALVALLIASAQIILGGWVSTNYAALACTDLPLCRGAWVPPMDFGNAFHVIRELGMTPEGDLLSNEALTAIHWMHRVGAIIVIGFMAPFAWRLFRAGEPLLAAALALIVGLQFLLGLANVVFSLPLALAAAHNGGAALLLALLVVINFQVRGASRSF